VAAAAADFAEQCGSTTVSHTVQPPATGTQAKKKREKGIGD
jgi:hypothetical protein